jgi:NTP pyrophosphatase (non-canonical NTP hydrolase)
MADFTMEQMQEMQKRLQEKYQHKWGEPIGPEIGKNKLLWMIGEISEVADIIKKNGAQAAITDERLRKALVEEMADVLMYYNDVMLCYGITPEELQKAYTEKFERNMNRW